MQAQSIAFIFCAFMLFTACQPTEEKTQQKAFSQQEKEAPFQVEHARGFRVVFHDTYKEVEVTKPWKDARTSFKYILVPHDQEVPEHDADATVIRIPVRKAVATSTTHLPTFDLLNASEVIGGFPNTDYISSEKMRQQIKEGKLTDLGPENNINMEVLLSLEPDIIMSYAMGPQSSGVDKFRRTGIPVVINADYMENTPLGRAEWIKFTALFLNKEKEAEEVFNRIASRYDSLKNLAASAKEKPSVYSGIVYGDIWYMPGGESWAARFINDANGHYLWSDNYSSGSQELSFEAVYAKAHDADYWLNTGSFASLKAIANHDSRYTNFKPFEKGQVFNNNAKVGEKGGYTFLELGCSRPDIVLADLIKILHPELMPDYTLYFYQKLN